MYNNKFLKNKLIFCFERNTARNMFLDTLIYSESYFSAVIQRLDRVLSI